jgi:hypothetical protein
MIFETAIKSVAGGIGAVLGSAGSALLAVTMVDGESHGVSLAVLFAAITATAGVTSAAVVAFVSIKNEQKRLAQEAAANRKQLAHIVHALARVPCLRGAMGDLVELPDDCIGRDGES